MIEKINILKQHLLIKNDSYGDVMKEEIYFLFFENENSFSFLDELKSKEEIEDKVDLLVSKMILHEHEDSLENIIENYL